MGRAINFCGFLQTARQTVEIPLNQPGSKRYGPACIDEDQSPQIVQQIQLQQQNIDRNHTHEGRKHLQYEHKHKPLLASGKAKAGEGIGCGYDKHGGQNHVHHSDKQRIFVPR
ncbi:hypothetical protein D3C81_1744400 [compost metagenome]